ncbi:hypothetical protein BH09DEP1_BH09DEP1_1570 [soil metagenome]
MAFSKFLTLCALFFSNFTGTNPHSEFLEMRESLRASRANSPRRTQSSAAPHTVAAQQPEEGCCWAFLSCFCSLMEYAGNSSPHPIIRTGRERSTR